MPINLATREAILTVLCLSQVIGASLAVVAATFDIKTIITSGWLFTPFGALLAWLVRKNGPRALAILGISAGCLSVSLFALINCLEWGPSDAELPVGIILLVYQTVTMPLGWLAWRALLAPAGGNPFGTTHTFSLRELLIVMAGCSVALASVKVGLNYGASMLSSTAIGLSVATTLGLVGVWLSVRRPRGIELASDEGAPS